MRGTHMVMILMVSYIKLIKNGKEYYATIVPTIVLIKTVLQEMHDHFGIGKTYSLIKRYFYWPKMIKHIQAHVDICSLCRREKMQADKYQLRYQEENLLKCPLTLLLKCLLHIMTIKIS